MPDALRLSGLQDACLLYTSNVTAQFNYGVFLSDTNPTLSEYYNLNRAIYWMEFAVNNGNIDAKSKLQELKKLKRMDRRKNKENP